MSVIDLPGDIADHIAEYLAGQHQARQRLDQARADYPTPGALAMAVTPGTQQTPALDLIDQELIRLFDEPGGRCIFSMPPQQGKSTRISKDFPTWALIHDPERPIMVCSYGASLAERNGENIRNTIDWNDLGISIAPGSSSKKKWRLADHNGGVLSVGIGSGATGWASGLTIIDDPVKDWQEANSAVFRERVWNWWLTVAQTRLAPGAPVAVVLTRWHEDDLAGRLISAPDGHRWRVVNIPAQADHDPAKGETDPLGRQPGEYLRTARTIKDKHTGEQRPLTDKENAEYWEDIKAGVGARTWAALYQGRPTPGDGELFHREHFTDNMYSQPMWVVRGDGSCVTTNPGDQLLISVDATFKDTAGADNVAMGVWLRRGVDVYLLDQVCDVMSFVETCDRLVALAAKWPQAILKLVEDKANGPAIISMLSRTVPGLVPEEPQGGKVARANAIAPFVEAGNVHLPHPSIAPWVGDMVEELAAFPAGKHDDQVDQMTQAVNRLLLQPIWADPEDAVVQPEEFDELDAQGFVYSRF